MLTRVVFAVFLTICGVAVLPSRVDACSCVGGFPLCQTFWRTHAVFAGEVLNISDTANPSGEQFPPYRRVRFRVLQAWRGSVSNIVEVTTGAGGGDCGYSFQQGVRYLVFASGRNGTLYTGICSRTQRLDDASEALAYLNSALQPKATGRIFGSVVYERDPDLEESRSRPITGYPVELSNGRQTWKTITAADGTFDFNVPAGDYAVKLTTPSTEYAYAPSDVTLADARGCAAADFVVVPDGRLTVRVLDPAGMPRRQLSIELIDVDRTTGGAYVPDASTNGDGVVHFEQLRPKRYALAINATRLPSAKQPFATNYFPGVAILTDAKVIDLAPGERLDLGEWIIPDALGQRRITGVVVWPIGQPASAVDVSLRGVRNTLSAFRSVEGGYGRTDEQGHFTLVAYEGQAYEVRAYIAVGDPAVPWSATVPSVVAGDSLEPLRLVLATITRR
jgi:hypothetical protein